MSDDQRDPPIEEPGYKFGVNVIDIGDLRVARGRTRRPASSCRHIRLNYDPTERRIWCQDCERNVEAFDAFEMLVGQFAAAKTTADRRKKELDEAEKFAIRSLAAKKLDEAWRHRSMVPACPHCNHGLFPENFKHGMSMMSRDYAQARIDAKPKR